MSRQARRGMELQPGQPPVSCDVLRRGVEVVEYRAGVSGEKFAYVGEKSAYAGRKSTRVGRNPRARGVQYASDDHQHLLARHDITCSMSAKGDCYDNAAMESF